MIDFENRGPSGAAAPLTHTFLANASATSTSTITASDISLGTPDANRVIVVIASQRGSACTGVTIAGKTAIEVVSSTGANRKISIWRYSLGIGQGGGVTSGDVEATFGSSGGCVISVYALYPAVATPEDSGVGEVLNIQATASNVAKTAGGFVVIGGVVNSGSSEITLSQNGAETITEDFNARVTDKHVRGSFIVTQTSSTRDFTVTVSSSFNLAIVAASWS